ncbi:hypothetical protein WJX81_002990 [Elliptochloris bilobata]|uniref:NADH dehydrogenase [ubiquinone] 1 alpha subcomplex subunit 13 n=1 Tax=Elliptochloris bilobata TaxID=381761 RepID=A0AAW1RIA7_9CHLO
MTETLRRGYPGMKSVHDMPAVQDGPPPGGYPAIRFARRIPNTGPSGFTLFAVSAAVMAYGFYKVGEGNLERRALRAETVAMREMLYPVMQAEEDRRWVKEKQKCLENEAKIMKDVPGWEVGKSPYFGKRHWVPPAQPVGAYRELL